jgi:hypothetical protein
MDPLEIVLYMLWGLLAMVVIVMIIGTIIVLKSGTSSRGIDNESNTGRIGIDTGGDLTMGIGSGLGIDLSDGSLTVDVGSGVHIDVGGDFHKFP